MGLDISAVSKIVTKKESPEAYEFNMLLDAKTDTMYINPDYTPQVAEYNGGDSDDVIEYVKTEDSKSLDFSAGSYKAYNTFRNLLALGVLGVPAESVWEKPEKYAKSPMFLMIEFSDCEGTMDSATCKQLSEDFKANRDKFEAYLKSDSGIGEMDTEHHLEAYDNWQKAYDIGSDEGAVIFC